MSIPVVSLAIFDGYWGQVFEYWPFSLLITVTVVYSIVAFGSDMVSRRRWKPPAGATPRMYFEADPGVFARGKFRTGLYLIRFGATVALAATALICYLSYYPLAIGNNYGLDQDVNNATAAGTTISLVLSILMFVSAVYVRKLPLPLISFVLVGIVAALVSPAIANGEMRWFGIMLAMLGIPLVMILIGSTLALKHYAGTKIPVKYIAPTAPPPPVGVA